jgi:hypothetical protein
MNMGIYYSLYSDQRMNTRENLPGSSLNRLHGIVHMMISPDKLISKNIYQKGQGMVEFAIVLPILLLLILGIFAFAHLFFTYIVVNSAAREGARLGAAVGYSANSLPHYRDCSEIRNAVMRIGRTVGVNNDSQINIVYTRGASQTQLTSCASGSGTDCCPAGGAGPSDIQSADQLKVSINLTYTPAFPIVKLPTFNVKGTAARTIISDVYLPATP